MEGIRSFHLNMTHGTLCTRRWKCPLNLSLTVINPLQEGSLPTARQSVSRIRLFNNPIWYGCQGESWAELESCIRKLGERVQISVTLNPRMPLRSAPKGMDEAFPLFLSPHPNINGLIRKLGNVGRSRPALLKSLMDDKSGVPKSEHDPSGPPSRE